MSANGTFSTTLDYDFFAGGVVKTGGEVSSVFDLSLSTSGKVLVVGQAAGELDFTFQAGAQLPEVDGTVDVSFGFDVSSTVEFGVQIYGKSEFVNTVEFGVSAEGYSIITGSLEQTLDFNLKSNFIIFSDGTASGSIGFTSSSTGINYSIHSSSFDGINEVRIPSTLSHNDYILVNKSNDVKIDRNGINGVIVLQT